MSSASGRVAALCRLFGVRYPILLAGMTSVGNAALAGAVSEAGGLGLLAAGRMSPEAFQREVDEARRLSQKPIGVNIPVIRDAALMQVLIDIALRAELSPIVLGGGNPAPWADQIRKAGRQLVIVTAGPIQAKKAESLGCCAVVVAGFEAGGKTGADEVGGLVAIPAVADAVSIPVIASGGIVDGRSAAAAICLGAAAVQVGTRFMLATESPVHPVTKEAMIAADVTSTRIVARSHGMGRRMLDTPTARHVLEREQQVSFEEMVAMLSGAVSERGLLAGDLASGTVACGQSVGRVSVVEPAEAIVRRMIVGMGQALEDTLGEIRTISG